jgi:6-phosphogluconolactonase
MSIQTQPDSYERNIREFFGSNKGAIPRFDLVLLGLGLDGHTASLFPGNPALSVLDRVAIPVSQEGIPEPRITLTLPVINNADTVCFIVSGLEKAGIVREVLEGEGHNLPANKIIPRQGKLYWFLDRNAASGLQDRDNLG